MITKRDQDMPDPISEETPNRWQSDYQKLPSSSKKLLQLLAIHYTPMTAIQLQKVAIKAGAYRPPRQHALSMTTFLGLLKKMEKRGLVVGIDKSYTVPPAYLGELMLQAIDDGAYQDLVSALEQISSGAIAITGMVEGKVNLHCSEFTQGLRATRIAFFSGDGPLVDAWIVELEKRFPRSLALLHPLAAILGKTTDMAWFLTLPKKYIREGLKRGFLAAQWNLQAATRSVTLAETYCESHKDALAESLQRELAYHALLQGEWDQARARSDAKSPNVVYGMIALAKGDIREAVAQLEGALDADMVRSRQEKAWPCGLASVGLALALCKEGASNTTAADYKRALQDDHPLFSHAYLLLQDFVRLRDTPDAGAESARKIAKTSLPPTCSSIISMLFIHWLAPRTFAAHIGLQEALLRAFERAFDAGYGWLAAECGTLLDFYELGTPESRAHTKAFWEANDATGIVALFATKPMWESSLEALLTLQKERARQSVGDGSHLQQEQQERLTWRIHHKGKSFQVQPYLQKQSATGAWSKGRKLEIDALGRTAHRGVPPKYMTPADLVVCAHIQQTESHWGKRGPYQIDDEAAALALVEHPHVYWLDPPQTQVEVVQEEPRLQIVSADDQLIIQLDPPFQTGQSVAVRPSGPGRLILIEIAKALHEIAAIIGQGLQVPIDAKDKVLEVIYAIAPIITIHADIDGSDYTEEVEASTQTVVRLWPRGAGLRVVLLVRPFGQEGPCLEPGEGGASVFATLGGISQYARRDLDAEARQARKVRALDPRKEAGLADADDDRPGSNSWQIEDTEDCMAFLVALQGMGDAISLEWPKGQHIRLRGELSSADFKASVTQENDWFAITGSLEVDATTVLDMRKLLALTAEHSGRFLPLGDGDFIALTERFRSKLDAMVAYTETQGDAQRFHQTASLAMQETLGGWGEGEASDAWQAQRERLKTIPEVSVPSTFQGELREYQVEGFEWLSRLTHWGLGACLADQMGLGKTLQTLALLLQRAHDGPALAVAPTSVCGNWHDEAERFAPSLQVHDLGTWDIESRQTRIEALGPGDLLLCSYGLLPYAQDALQAKTWSTIVLDEAQAIKNPLTQRAKTVFAMECRAKILTTGTPIENHLGDLWSLFRFLNPGLLGPWKQFQRRFAEPIERDQNPKAREQLKQLVQPFILRRRKEDVLKELPPRTEITLRVQPTPAETAFYEALREEALESIDAAETGDGQFHLQILAALTKLRQACCHPSLVLPESTLPGAKHVAFAELIDQLLDDGHKVLVFSQFVRHLGLLQEILKKKKIPHQYLDGSTQAKVRKKRIKAFQAGEGDVFLISLKAGGSGINLTAADYVIHMDPWWNPAVEDQASDRAHRIGQQNPVTIYRLIVEGSIEEKIVALHQHKRDLAESLLDGSEMTGKMSADELIALIREAG